MVGRAEGEISGLLDDFRKRMQDIAAAQRQRVKLTATATTRDKLVSVTVNANGVVIETRFADRIDELSYADIAKAVTKMAQQAADEVFRKSKELAAPLLEERARLPKLSDVIEGMPDVEREIPLEPPVSVAPPGSPERDEDEAMTFDDVESLDHARADPGKGVTGQAW
ncbi:YbaB/EbfC family nucleoid-associated protein [Nocardia sp. NPDC049707]|uniref:YbaB/EbfC family nucleoid-associated protein n=1 Tax=Nocardia sp. NPDC049707 TaxID=3154735 RepID=UPI00343E20B6